MRRIIICLTMLGLALGLNTQAQAANIVVSGSRSQADLADDVTLVQAITDLGHTVTYVTLNTATAADLVGQDLVFISESIGGGDDALVDAFVGTADIPVIIAEPGALVGLGMCADSGGDADGTTAMTIINDADPIAAGLSNGAVTIYLANAIIVWGDAPTLTADANIVAEYTDPTDNTTHPTLFYYEPGDTMFDRTAPNYRGFWFADRQGFGGINTLNLSTDALTLLDNMLNLFLTPPPPPITLVPFEEIIASDDAFVSNDDNFNDRDGVDANGDAVHVRYFSNGTDTFRLRVGYLRFDLTSIDPNYVSGTFEDVVLSLARINGDANGLIDIYGISESFDLEAPSDTSFNTGAGIDQSASPNINEAIVLDLAELTTPTTVQLLGTGGEVTETSSTAITDFINADTDGIVTFLLAPSGDFDIGISNQIGALVTSIEGATPPNADAEDEGDHPRLSGIVGVTSVNRAKTWTMFE